MFSKKSYVGIDLGHFSVKLVEIDRTPQGWKISRSTSFTTPEHSLRDGKVSDPNAMGAAIKAAMKAAGMNAKHAVVSVQGASVVVRNVRLPRMAPQVLQKSIKYEAGRYVPTSVEDSYIEFEIIGLVDESQMEALIVAAPKDLVESRMAACEAAGLTVDVVDVGSFASYRSLIEANPSQNWMDKTVALVDFGCTTTNVSVISNGFFSMCRTVASGSANLTEALKTFFDLTAEDAELGKSQLNIAELLDEKPTENPPLRVLHPYVDELVREIRRSINYYESQQVDGVIPSPVTTIILTGGGSKLNGTQAYLSAKLGLEVLTLGVFDNPTVIQATPPIDRGEDLSVASGLAMRPLIKAA